jgi:elongation factor Ts
MVTMEQIRELRRRTEAGVTECKHALTEAEGDVERAAALLRERGIREAERREERATRAGLVGSYVHHDGRLGALVEVGCETDFVARTEAFRTLVRHLAEQVAAVDSLGTTVDVEVLLGQPWVREPKVTVGELVREVASKVGEHVQVRRFARFDLET